MTNPMFAIDPITGFVDRSDGVALIRQLIAEADGQHRTLAAWWLNVDRFRVINASFGHRGGDRFIAHLARRMRTAMPRDARWIRMGGDEFVVVLAVPAASAAESLGRMLAGTLERPLRLTSMRIHPTVSIGLAVHRPDEDPQVLLERADRAMLDAKRLGGNRLIVSDGPGDKILPGMHLAREELLIDSQLHHALKTGDLMLFYQPVLARNGTIEAVESLMRCRVGDEWLMPGRFIPVAEKTGLIVRLGEWSLLQGTRFAARLRDEGRPCKVAINVSRAQLTSPEFLLALHGALLCANLDPALIEVELTESLAMDPSRIVQDNLRSIRASGVGLAIDDFGTGYSSLSCLKDLNATKLKLDRAFVSVLPGDARALMVVKAVTQLARDLGMIVVAEGVESEAQRETLLAAGVDALQGYLLARPMDETVLLNWLNTRSCP